MGHFRVKRKNTKPSIKIISNSNIRAPNLNESIMFRIIMCDNYTDPIYEIKTLLEKGADINYQQTINNSVRLPLISIAVYRRNVSIISALLEYSPNLSLFDYKNRSSFFCAGSISETEIAKLLLKDCKHINTPDIYGVTPLMAYITSDNPTPEFIKFLLDNSANINSKDNTGMTALMYARRCCGELSEIVKLLELASIN